MIEKILDSTVCWAILLLALAVYQLIWHELLHSKAHNSIRAGAWHEMTPYLIGALPLLGLLGTIVGLLDAFALLAQGQPDALSGAIGEALLTTQLGLVCAIPAWLMQAYLARRQRQLQAPEAQSWIAVDAK